MLWTEPVTLVGTHVRLEPLREDHTEGLLAAGADPEVWRWLPWPPPMTVQDMRAIIDAQLTEAAAGRRVPLVQCSVRDGVPVGMTALWDGSARDSWVEIGGTWIGRPWWRTAINTEAKLLLLGHLFDTLGVGRVQLKTDACNLRSQAAIRRLGATQEGTLRRHARRPDGTMRDSVFFSLLPEEWPEARDRLRERLAAG